MKRRLLVFTMFVIVFGSAQAAMAQSPHFISASAAGPDSDGDVRVSFKEAGLGSNSLINYLASADASAVYACINGGGNHPQAANKATVSGPVATPGTFSSGRNGTISQSLTISPPDPGGFSCPGGQQLVLASVTYSNVKITDTTNNTFESIPGTFSRTFFTF